MFPPFPARPRAALRRQTPGSRWRSAGRALGTVRQCSTRRRSRPPWRSSRPTIPTSRRSSIVTVRPASGRASPGLATLVLLILEQQVSLASARAAYDRLVGRLGGLTTEGILRSTDEELRGDGFSRQKARYVWPLAGAIEEGSLDLDAVASLDDQARAALVALPGIGPRTAEVYLLSALRRPDTWPVGDIALQEGARRTAPRDASPPDALVRSARRGGRTGRPTAARLLWHLYLSDRTR